MMTIYSQTLLHLPLSIKVKFNLMSAHIFLVDDDQLLRRSIASNAEDALDLLKRNTPDLVLLDIGLPGMDGLQAVRHFQDSGIPVIFLTARRRELDEILGLELGAEDYITKPFDTDVLLARIRVVLRRSQRLDRQQISLERLVLGDLEIDPAAHTVTLRGQPVELSAREFNLLHVLALEVGHVVPMDKLLAQVWGAEFMGEPQVVYVHIHWLRQKLEDQPNSPKRIVTVRGVGYKLVSQGLGNSS
jgi:DNA-binding response OmpR family regulator